MDPLQEEKHFSLYKPLLAIVTGLLALYAFAQVIGFFYSLFALLGISIVLTYILIGPVRLVEKAFIFLSNKIHRKYSELRLLKHSPIVNARIGAVIMVYFSFFLISMLASMRLGPVLIVQLEEFSNSIPLVISHGETAALEWAGHYLSAATIKHLFREDLQNAKKLGMVKQPTQENEPISQEEKTVIQQAVTQTGVNEIGRFIEKTLISSVSHLIDIITGTFNGAVYTLSGAILVFYFLLDGNRIKEGVLRLLPGEYRKTGNFVLERAHEVMWGFIKGQVFIGMFTGTALFFIYSFFRVKYAVILGVILGVSELVPMIGPWFGQAIAYIIILSSPTPWIIIPVWLCAHGYMMIKDNILMPRIVGHVMGLHPVIILSAIIFCTEMMGLIGVVLAIPLASLANVLLHQFIIQKDYEKLRHTEVTGELG